MSAAEPEKKFYQGVLQISVALYHLRDRNWRGAAILLGEGINRLRHYQPSYYNINVTQFIEDSAELLSALQQSGPENIDSFAQQLFAAETANPAANSHSLQLPTLVKQN
jgi:hypothetical protein